MTGESVRDFYNRQYTAYQQRQLPCPNALQDLAKAHRRVTGALRCFGIDKRLPRAKVLDVGAGLGYYTKALTSTGADVTGLDFSNAAIDAARTKFPDCKFVHAPWPDGVPQDAQYDLIWVVNFSVMNTFDVDFIHAAVVREALLRLRPGGHLIVGWNTDLSGRVLEGYSHWSFSTIRHLRTRCGLSAPVVIEMGKGWLCWLAIHAAYVFRRSIPVFMTLRKEVHESMNGQRDERLG